MTKPTLLTSEMIAEIVRLYKLRVAWIDIAASVGINRRTLQNWRRLGEKSKSGIYRDLVIAIEKVDHERSERFWEKYQESNLRQTRQVGIYDFH